ARERFGIVFSSGEVEARHRDGRTMMIETSAGPILGSDGSVVGRVAISTDISERKRAEHLLGESEERFRAIFERAGIGIAIGDLEPSIVMANQAMADFF